MRAIVALLHSFLLVSTILVSFNGIFLALTAINDFSDVTRDLTLFNRQDWLVSTRALAPYPCLEEYRQSPLRQPLPRPTNGCTYHNANYYCRYHKLQIHPSKISAAKLGGEPLHTVMGQDEKDELVTYANGAFTVPTPPTFNISRSIKKNWHTKEVLEAVQVQNSTCTSTTDRLTFLVPRRDYVHIYFTILLLMNAFWELPDDNGDVNAPVNVIFLDAHPQGSLDNVWQQLFGGSVTHVRRLPSDSSVCYDNAVLISDEKSSLTRQDGLHQVANVEPSPVMVDSFVHFVLQRYQLDKVQMEPGRITLFQRGPYLAHARSDLSKRHRVVQNMPTIRERLLATEGVTSVQVLRLETMTFREQVEAIRKSNVILASHGAALVHLLWLHNGTTTMEIETDNNSFQLLSRWKPGTKFVALPELDLKVTHEVRISEEYMEQHIVPAVKNAVQQSPQKG